MARWTFVSFLPVLVTPFLSAEAARLEVFPDSVCLSGRTARQQLLVTAVREEASRDRTRTATYRSLDPSIARVGPDGVVTPAGDGTTAVVILADGAEARVPVEVEGAASFHPVTFERDIQPILTRSGCNSGPCHGKQRGQNGFQLSLLGFDDDFDYEAIVYQARGRRVFPASPRESLLLLKPSASVPHGGGRRLELDGLRYQVLERWIATGMARTPHSAPRLERISVTPRERLLGPREEQQLAVTAHYSDGAAGDVTHLASFQSNESPIAAADEHGLIKAGPIPGEAAIMARFMGKFATATVSIPLPGEVPGDLYDELPRRNFIDELVWEKLRRLRITPSEPCSDATFLRRAHIDIIGRLPTPEEARAFFSDPSPEKRSRLVERLLERPEYADHWANLWMDLLRPNPYRVGIKAVRSLDSWIREQFRENRPYDAFVRDLLTARGSTFRNGAVTVFRDRRSSDEIVTMTSQLFLGIRLECAKCHQHPFEVWSQRDYYSLAAYFARIGRKGTGLSPPISGSEEFVFIAARGDVRHPLTEEVLSPRPLFGEAPAIGEGDDPRQALAEWITSAKNPFFPRVIANRVWAELMGRGLVEPVDDLRESNPPTNAALLDALAGYLRAQDYDLKKLIHLIATSHVYGLSSAPSDRNTADTRYYSRHYRERLRAEILLDAVSDITEVPERFEAMPPGARAIELWTHRADSVFLDTFGRPDPNQDPPCMRTGETTVTQALHLMNAPRLHAKVTSDDGRAARLAASSMTAGEIADELYLLAYSRLPSEDERRTALEWLERHNDARRRAVEDLLWALLNSPEFVFED